MAVRIFSTLGRGNKIDNRLTAGLELTVTTSNVITRDETTYGNSAVDRLADFISVVGGVADLAAEVKRKADAAAESIKDAQRVLSRAENNSERLEDILDTLDNFPNPVVRKIVFAAKAGNDGVGAQFKAVNDGLNAIDRGFTQFLPKATTLERIANVATGVDAITLTVDLVRSVLEEDGNFFQTLSGNFISDFLAERFVPTDDDIFGSSVTGAAVAEGDLIIPLPQADANQNVAEDVALAFDVFSGRLLLREMQIEDMSDRFQAIVDSIDALLPDELPVGMSVRDYLEETLTGGLQDFLDVLDDLPFDALNGIGRVLDPIGDVIGALRVVQDAVQPILDFFGPVTSLINSAISALEDALGLSKLKEFIADAIADGINTLTQPIRDAIQDVIDELAGSVLQVIEEVFAELVDLRDNVLELALNPVGVAGDAANDLLDDKAIASGQDGDDIIALKLDSRFDDGYGGLALGGAGNDVLRGTELADVMNGGADDDLVLGFGGNDQLFGGSGENTVDGGAGDDVILGGADNDVLIGGTGADKLFGDAGDDSLFGGDGDDLLDGEDGNDRLEDGAGNDILLGGDGNDTLIGTEGSNRLDGQDGLDMIRTLGATTAVHRTLDSTAILVGGAGRDIVDIGNAFASGEVIADGVFYDAGSNDDVFLAGSLDLNALAPRLEGFETLEIHSVGSETLVTEIDDLRNFDTLELTGTGEVTLDILDPVGLFRMDSPFTNHTLLIDFDGLTPVANPQDGATAGVSGKPSSQLAPITIQLNGNGDAMGTVATSLGMTFLGSDGDNLIVGGGGSDVIRAGLGTDTIDGGPSDVGDRFDLDSAIGDIILGTPDELDGDTIRNLTNRVDRVRILGSEDYALDVDSDAGSTVVSIYASQAILDAGGPALGVFTLDGDYPKLASRAGSFLSDEGEVVTYVEVFNNNVPPTAVEDNYITTYQRPGRGFEIDPFANDYDVDTPLDPEAGIERRQIANEASLMELFRTNGEVTNGTRVITELGNAVVFRDGKLFYETNAPSIVAERYTSAEAALLGHASLLGDFDITQDLPFFGRDRLTYQVLDLEGEVSNTTSIDVLIRPEKVIPQAGGLAYQDVDIFAPGVGSLSLTLTPRAEGSEPIVGSRPDFLDPSDLNEALPRPFLGNEVFEPVTQVVTVAGAGNDVIDGRGATTGLALFGGTNSDWVEGGAFDDLLVGGGVDDFIVDLTGTEVMTPDILLGGRGNNVFSANVDAPGGIFSDDYSRSRDTIYILDGVEDIVTGPLIAADAEPGGPNSISFNPVANVGPTALAALGLQDDLIVGFDTEDALVLPVDPTSLVAIAPEPAGFVEDVSFIGVPFIDFVARFETATGLVITSLDLDAELGQSNRVLIPDLFPSLDLNTDGSEGRSVSTIQTNFIGFENDYDGLPAILSYDVAADAFDPDGGVSATTDLTVTLKSYLFEQVFDTGGADIGFVGIFPVVTLDYAVSGNLIRSDELIDPSDVFGDGEVSFTMELDGRYRDRFIVELAPLSEVSTAPFVSVGDTADRFVEPEFGGYDYSYFDLDALRAASGDAPLGLVVRYVSEAADANADTVSVRRGDAVTFDLTANDTDADGDEIGIFDIVFDSAEQEAILLDGDTSNGELILQTDPNTGFGTGIVTYVAAPEFIGDVNFAYIATDGEFESGPADVSITVTGLPPELGDDRIILPFASDLRVPLVDLLANDSDPDTGVLDPAAVDIVYTNFGPLPGGSVTFENNEVVYFESVRGVLEADPINPDGTGGTPQTFNYEILDAEGAGKSERATVEVFFADEFLVSNPDVQTVEEDGSIAIDLLAGRSGGYGEAEILSVSAPVIEGLGLAAGTAEVSGTGVVFTPRADLSNAIATITVTLRDELGSTTQADLRVSISPVEDDPVLILLGTPDPEVLSTLEDTEASGSLQLSDADIDDVPMLASLDPITTDGQGTLTLTEGELPGLFEYTYTPNADFSGSDRAVVVLADGNEVVLDILVAPVNDAPRNLSPFGAQAIDVGATQILDLVRNLTDVDGALDLGSLRLEAQPNPDVLEISLDAEGLLTLTGAGSGETSFTYSIADDLGARSASQVVSVDVNLPPEAVNDRVELFAPFAPILIDAIANDSDGDGTVAYATDADGQPLAIDPGEGLGADGTGLLGEVTWSEVDGAFLYTAPSDPKFIGQTDVFYYEIVDNDGAASRGSVFVDLLPSNAPALRFSAATAIDLRDTPEDLVLGGDTKEVTGGLNDFDGDTLFGITSDSRIIVEDVDPASLVLTTVRDRGAAPDPLSADALRGPLNAAAVLGTASLTALTDAFIGDTLLTLSDGTNKSVIRLDGAYLGTFSVAENGSGGTVITYTPTASGEGDLTGTQQDDDISGDDGSGSRLGLAGDDVVQGGGELSGGAGRDALIGGPDGDTLTGGEDADLFLLNDDAAPDTILDFNPFEGDRIAIGLQAYLNDDQTAALDRLSVVYNPDLDLLQLIGDPNAPDDEGNIVTDLPDAVLANFSLTGGLLAEDAAASGDEDQLIDGTLAQAVFGLDGADRTFTLNTGATHGVATVNPDGTFTYSPNDDFFGTDTFTYEVAAGSALGEVRETATVTLTVAAVNDAPVLQVGAPFELMENSTGPIGPVLATDVDGPVLAYAITGGADAALFDIDGTSGELSFKAAPDFETPLDEGGDNSYALEITASDGSLTDSADILVKVLDEDETPPVTIEEGSSGSDNLVGSDGADILRGQGGPFDTLTGLGGSDVFEIAVTEGNGMELAVITDYEIGVDAIDLGGSMVQSSLSNGDAMYLYLNYTDFDIVIVNGATTLDEISFV